MLMTYTALMMMSIAFMMISHPMTGGLILIIQTLAVSLTIGLTINNFWLSYITVITILSGMLVMFIYMASIASNEMFKLSKYMMITPIIAIMIIIFNKDQININWNFFNGSLMDYSSMITLIKIFNPSKYKITIIMIIYLLLTMIVITSIVNVHKGPMVQKN